MRDNLVEGQNLLNRQLVFPFRKLFVHSESQRIACQASFGIVSVRFNRIEILRSVDHDDEILTEGNRVVDLVRLNGNLNFPLLEA